jgi:hypothetical protein
MEHCVRLLFPSAIERCLWIGKGKSIPHTVYRVWQQNRPEEPALYDIVEVQYDDCGLRQEHNGHRRATTQTGEFTRESKRRRDIWNQNDEKPVMIYARLMPAVVKLELRPQTHRKREIRIFGHLENTSQATVVTPG